MLVFRSNEKYLIHKKIKQEILFQYIFCQIIFTERPSFVVHNIYIYIDNSQNSQQKIKICCLPKQEQLQVLRIMAVAGAALEDLSGRLATLAPLAEAWDGGW